MRIRSIKPEFWTSHDIAQLDEAAALHFIGLWSYAQDNGVGRDDSRLLKAALYPLRDEVTPAEVDRRMMILHGAGLIERYTSQGVCLYYLPSWDKHQVINRASRAVFSRPSDTPPRVLDEPSVSPPQEKVIGAGSREQGAGSREHGKLHERAVASPGDTVRTVPDDMSRGPLVTATVMEAVRKHLYIPDGKPPEGWDAGRDIRIAHAILGKGTKLGELCDAIEGIALVRERGELDWVKPGEKMTLRALYRTKSGILPTWTIALNALHAAPRTRAEKRQDRKAAPSSIRDLLKGGQP